MSNTDPLVIEPLTKHHDRGSFQCGIESFDIYTRSGWDLGVQSASACRITLFVHSKARGRRIASFRQEIAKASNTCRTDR